MPAKNRLSINWRPLASIAVAFGIVGGAGYGVYTVFGWIANSDKVSQAKVSQELGITYELKSPNVFRIRELDYAYTFNFEAEQMAIRGPGGNDQYINFKDYGNQKFIEKARTLACNIGNKSLGKLKTLETEAKITVTDSRQQVQHFVTKHCPVSP